MQIVSVIYDTSYLMNGGGVFSPKELSSLNNDKWVIMSSELSEQDWEIAENDVIEQHVIPVEVKLEIKRHLDSEEKAHSARVARAGCAQIIAQSGYREVSVAGGPNYSTRDPILGADSKTDKGIIELSRRFCVSEGHRLVYIASRDGGIQIEISHLYSQEQLQVYSSVTEQQFLLARDRLVVESAKKAMALRLNASNKPFWRSIFG